MNDLSNGNFKRLQREIEEDSTSINLLSQAHGFQQHEMAILLNESYRFTAITIQLPTPFIIEIEKRSLNNLEAQKTSDSQCNPEKNQ